MSLLSIQKTPRYEPALLRQAVEAHFAALEVEKDLSPGMKVLLKPNLLAARKPEQAVTTHPLLIQAVVDWLRERGIQDITLADSPGGPYMEGRLRSVYAASGMDTLTGVKLNDSLEAAPVEQPRGKVCRRFDVIGPVRQADFIINLPKVKTHGMTVVSLGVKNLFGVVPGLEKPALHYRHPGWEDFAGMLLDLADLIAPAVTLVDGVLAMEGDGPSGGTPRQLGYTFASRDVFALDRFLAEAVMGLEPEEIPLLRQAKERGWGRPGKNPALCPAQDPKRRLHRLPAGVPPGSRPGGHEPDFPPPPQNPPGKVHRLRPLRRKLPPKDYHHRRGQGENRPAGVHLLLLLPGDVPGAGGEVAALGPIEKHPVYPAGHSAG